MFAHTTQTSQSSTPPPPPNPTLLPSALPKDSPRNTSSSSTNLHPSTSTSITARPPFTPFFTLIEDVHTAEHHHPTVHYIFSDDDDELITDTALHIHDLQRQHLHPPHSGNSREKPAADAEKSTSTSTSVATNERYILLKLSADGARVASAQSMTADWQVLGAEISTAPTLEGSGGGSGEEGMMLRIEGTGGEKGVGREEGERLGLEGLVEVFGRRIGELRRVVERGEVTESNQGRF